MAVMALTLPIMAADGTYEDRINIAQEVETAINASSAQMLRNAKYDRYNERFIVMLMNPEEYKEIEKSGDEFAYEEWKMKSVESFRAELEKYPSFDKDKEYQLEVETIFSKYDFKGKYFKVRTVENVYFSMKGDKFIAPRGHFEFPNTLDRKQWDRDKHKIFMDIDKARAFDKLEPRKLLLRYTFTINRLDNSLRDFQYNKFKSENRLIPTIHGFVKYADVMTLDGKLIKRIDYTKKR